MTVTEWGIKTPASVKEPFAPASRHIIPSGAHTGMRDWIVLGVLNGLVVALSHLIFLLYAILGPAAFFVEFYHQSVENLLIASVYLLMAVTAPRRWPFTLNAVIWGIMGLMQGWWTLLPAAVPAGFIADLVIRRAVPQQRLGWVLLSFVFYTSMLSAGSFWPFLLLKQSDMVQRMTAMDPGVVAMVDKFTLPFCTSILAATFITALVGGYMALKLIARHFGMD
jgi:putative ECF transporter S component (TIGR02185 family)